MMIQHHTAQTNPLEVGMPKAILRECRECGKVYTAYKGNSGYCCMACYRSAQKAGKYIGTKGHKQERIHSCAQCGKQVIGTPSKDRSGKRCEKVFCSRGCYDQFRINIAKERTRQCDYCGKDYVKPGNVGNCRSRFCSAECRSLGLKAKPIRCVCCGALVSIVKFVPATGKFISSKSGKVCSRQCLIAWIKTNPVRKLKISLAFRGEKHPNWRGGPLVIQHQSAWARLASSIRDRDGHKCKKCGKPESGNGRKALEVHHIVPRRECLSVEIANHPDNLISLCTSCHMLVEWDGAQKRGTRRRGKRCKKAA